MAEAIKSLINYLLMELGNASLTCFEQSKAIIVKVSALRCTFLVLIKSYVFRFNQFLNFAYVFDKKKRTNQL